MGKVSGSYPPKKLKTTRKKLNGVIDYHFDFHILGKEVYVSFSNENSVIV